MLKNLTLFRALLVPCFFLLSSLGYAQGVKGQSDLCGGIGFQSFYKTIVDVFAFSGEHYHSSGALNVSYRYYFTRRFALGCNISYEHISQSNNNTSSHYGRDDMFTATPEVSFSYIDKVVGKNTGIRLYWLAAWGITAFNGSSSDGSRYNGYMPLGIQITPVGLRVGRDLAGYVEMGFGYKGLLDAGVSYRFPTKKHTVKFSDFYDKDR